MHVDPRPDLAAIGAGATTLLVVAVCLLLAAVGWRLAQALTVRRSIRRALSSGDPEVRRHGIELATDRGLGWSADMLLDLVREERDPAVLAGLVRAVARRQWEPASTARIVELRLWAKAYVDSHEELRAHDAGSPGQGAGARSARRSSDATDADLATIGAIPTPATAPDAAPAPNAAPAPARPPGAKVRVLVTGAGGAAGVAVIRDLRRNGHWVFAVDADPGAVGLRLADEGRPVPRADEPGFVDALCAVVADTRAQALICTVAEEYPALVPAAERFAAVGVATLMPRLDAVLDCTDKWRFAKLAAAEGLPVPETVLGEADGLPGPWCVKPRHGRGSRDVHVVTEPGALAAALAATPEPMVQSLLTGREFTADALVDRDGTVLAVAPRWRLETKAGISTRGRTFDDPAVTEAVGRVLGALGLVGPANVQGFVAADGTVAVHEVNPRFSGGLPLTLHAGAEMVEEYLRLVMGEPARPERLVARADVTMYRHFAEVFEG